MSPTSYNRSSSLTSWPVLVDVPDEDTRSGTGTVHRWESLWSRIRGPLPADALKANFVSSACIAYASPHASAFDLKFYAEKRLAEVLKSGDATPSPEALRGLRKVLGVYVADNGPTPQVGPTQSGSVEIQWLAGGTLVAALFDRSGDYNVCAMDPARGVLFDEDVPAGEPIPEVLEGELHAVLTEMKAHVKVRPASWY
jgi:hypothetical protein